MMDSQKRTHERYREHELVLEISQVAEGWHYTVHVLAHEGDFDKLAHEECSNEPLASEIEALHAARVRGHAIIDEMAGS